MSDPLRGLKPTRGLLHVGVSRRFKVEVLDANNAVVVDAYSVTDARLVVDAFNTYAATGLAPSQLAKTLADEKALTAELVAALREVVRIYDIAPKRSEPLSISVARVVLARAKGGTR